MKSEADVLEVLLSKNNESFVLVKKGNSGKDLEKVANTLRNHSRNYMRLSSDFGTWGVYEMIVGYMISKGIPYEKYGEYSIDEAVKIEDPSAIKSLVPFLGKIGDFIGSVERADRNYASPETNPQGYAALKKQRNDLVAYAAFYRNKMEEKREEAEKAKSKDK
jgi:hypothetical protein